MATVTRTRTSLTCPKCERQMVRGFTTGELKSNPHSNTWVEGEVWRYVLYGGQSYPIATYRCPECGYLESYAK